MAASLFLISCATLEDEGQKLRDVIDTSKSEIQTLIKSGECSDSDKVALTRIDSEYYLMSAELNKLLKAFNNNPSEENSKKTGEEIVKLDEQAKKLSTEVAAIRKRCGAARDRQGSAQEETQSSQSKEGVCLTPDNRGGCLGTVVTTNADGLLMISRPSIPLTFSSVTPVPPDKKTDCGSITSSFDTSGPFVIADASADFTSPAACFMIPNSACVNCVTMVVVSSGGAATLTIFSKGAVSLSTTSVSMPPIGTPFVTTLPGSVFGTSGMFTVTVTNNGSTITASLVFMPM